MKAAFKLNSIVATYCKARDIAANAIVELRDTLQANHVELDKDALEQPLQHAVAAYYKVTFRQKEIGRGEGYTWDLPVKTKPGEAEVKPTANQLESVNAKRRYHTLVNELFGVGEAEQDTVSIPREVQALIDKAWALCVAKDAKLANKIMAKAEAKAKAKAKAAMQK